MIDDERYAIQTPATHPNHPVVGHRFRAHDGNVYYCDSYDPSCGYWMARIEPGYAKQDRRNVSERAIGRTFHHRACCGMR